MATVITLLVAGILAAPFAGGATATTQEGMDRDRAAALCTFEQRIDEYAVLRQQLEATLPPFVPSEDPMTFLRTRVAVATAIKDARPISEDTVIFTPPVANAFREVIARALAGRDVEALLRDLFAEHDVVESFHPRVYENYPEWATHEMPVVLLQYLPALPDDIQYRLVGHDLVLWDVHADLIIDVLRGAIPHRTT